jgi:hypothetical protein
MCVGTASRHARRDRAATLKRCRRSFRGACPRVRLFPGGGRRTVALPLPVEPAGTTDRMPVPHSSKFCQPALPVARISAGVSRIDLGTGAHEPRSSPAERRRLRCARWRGAAAARPAYRDSHVGNAERCRTMHATHAWFDKPRRSRGDWRVMHVARAAIGRVMHVARAAIGRVMHAARAAIGVLCMPPGGRIHGVRWRVPSIPPGGPPNYPLAGWPAASMT